MPATTAQKPLVLGFRSAGTLMTPEEFDAVTRYDEHFRYELIHGVLVVNPVPLGEETGPNELLAHFLLVYQESDPLGPALDDTLPQQYIATATGRRLADRVIWTGLGRMAVPGEDLPTIAVEFVSSGRRNRARDYLDKRREYGQAGLKEYWIIDRFQGTMTVVQYRPEGLQELIIAEKQIYQSPLLPGFNVPLGRLLAAADQRWQARRRRRRQ